MNEITKIEKINAAEYGLEENKASEIESAFLPVIERRKNLLEDYKNIVNQEISPELTKSARELRLKLSKVRTDTDKIHKATKAFYLAGGRFVDAWKNRNTEVIQQMETELETIEKHYENIRKKEIAELQTVREKEYKKYGQDIFIDLGNMTEEVWENFISGVKLQFENKKAEQAKIEAERIEKEKAEREEQARIRKENEELRKSQEKAELERKEAEAKLRAEKERAEKVERETREKAELERKEAEAKLRAKTEGSDAEKMSAYINEILLIQQPVFETEKYKLQIVKMNEIFGKLK